MVIIAGFSQGIEISHSLWRPKSTWSFEPALLLPTRQFHRAGPDWPATPRPALIVHLLRVAGKVVLFAPHNVSGLASRWQQSRQFRQHLFLLSMPELVASKLICAHLEFDCNPCVFTILVKGYGF
jgi:hypothetical protein